MAEERSQKVLHSFIVKAALKTAEEQFPDKIFDQKTIQGIQQKAESTVNELSQTLYKIRKEGKTGEDAVSHLTPERITQIKKALDMKTFHINIDKKKMTTQIKRYGKDVYPQINLTSLENLNQANDLQKCSIIIEAFILVLDMIGVEVPNDEEVIQNAIKVVAEELAQSNTLLQDVDQMIKDKDNLPALAKDIFVLVIDCIHADIFWSIVKALLSNMAWYDWALTLAQIAAFIALTIATDGLADIALLVVELTNAAFFIEKLVNLVTFSSMKSAM